MDARDILARAAARTGWNLDTQLELICRYVDNQAAADAFADFVDEAADDECGSPDDTDDLFAFHDRPERLSDETFSDADPGL
jgi:hypothetical protein